MNESVVQLGATSEPIRQHVEGTATASARSREQCLSAGQRILVVEDDEPFASFLASVIDRLGGEATIVGTVRAAAAQLENVDAWTAITLDVSLVDGSGLGVLSRIRAASCSLPALVLTGSLNRDVANAAFELDAHYLVKPVTMTLLEHFVRQSGKQANRYRPPVPAVADLPDDLRKLVGEVLAAARAEGCAHEEYVYRMALLARAASGRTHRGRSITAACAAAVNTSRSAFQEYAAVTARWSPSDVRLLLGRHDRRGHPVTLFHLLTIVRAPGAQRAQLERLLREGGDLRQLRSLRPRQ